MPPSPDTAAARAARTRILDAARTALFASGYHALTMDALAHELGMSKKTLYIHFPGKEAIVGAVIDALGRSLRSRMDALLSASGRTFTQRLCGVVDVVGTTLAGTSPAMFRELQRFAPALYQQIEDLRQETIPYVFGRLIRTGIAEGMVRPEIDPVFATEFWLQAIRGLVQPAVIERTGLSFRQTLEKALHLFFHGLLTPAGRKDYEKPIASRARQVSV